MSVIGKIGYHHCQWWVVLLCLIACLDTYAIMPSTDDSGGLTIVKKVGEIFAGQKVPVVFEIPNPGDRVLKIRKVQSTCKCVRVDGFPKSIAAGSSGKVKVTLLSKDLDGDFNFVVYVMTGNQHSSIIVCRLNGKVKTLFSAKPKYVILGNLIFGKKSRVITISLTPRPEATARIIKIESDSPFIKTSLQSIDAEKSGKNHLAGYELKVWAEPGLPVGIVNRVINLRTTDKLQPLVTIPVKGVVLGEIQVMPSTAYFNIRRSNVSSFKRTIKVSLRKGIETDLIIKSVTCVPQKLVSATVHKLQQGREYNIEIVLNSSVPGGPFKGEVVLRTNNPGQPEIAISVRGFVR